MNDVMYELNFENKSELTLTVKFLQGDFFSIYLSDFHTKLYGVIKDFVFNQGARKLVFDFKKINDISSYGIGLLMRISKICKNIEIINCQKPIRDMLRNLTTIKIK